MPSTPKNTVATIVPCFRYQDAAAAIEWLCRTFGFQKQAVYPGENDTIAHAQLTFGNGMIMLGSASNPGEFSPLMVSPNDIGGRQTQSCYLVVEDADAVYASAKAAGAEIVIDIKDQDYGGRDFTCRDPEGHLWSFGAYDPWKT